MTHQEIFLKNYENYGNVPINFNIIKYLKNKASVRYIYISMNKCFGDMNNKGRVRWAFDTDSVATFHSCHPELLILV